MKIGLFFGSFNPIHIGHLIIAQAVLDKADIQEVWFVVSPHNPHKSSRSLLHEFDRLDMVELAIEGNEYFKVSDVEFHLPKPSYTVHTLAHLEDKYPKHNFKLIIGEDNLKAFPKWKNSKVILENYGLLVYPRPGSKDSEIIKHANVVKIDAPLLNISATYVRSSIKEGKSIKYLVTQKTEEYIIDRKLYQ